MLLLVPSVAVTTVAEVKPETAATDVEKKFAPESVTTLAGACCPTPPGQVAEILGAAACTVSVTANVSNGFAAAFDSILIDAV